MGIIQRAPVGAGWTRLAVWFLKAASDLQASAARTSGPRADPSRIAFAWLTHGVAPTPPAAIGKQEVGGSENRNMDPSLKKTKNNKTPEVARSGPHWSGKSKRSTSLPLQMDDMRSHHEMNHGWNYCLLFTREIIRGNLRW